jgi:hypothetical protein
MSAPPESLEVGKCYLVRTGQPKHSQGIRRIVRIMPDGRVQFEQRVGLSRGFGWKAGVQDARSFALMVEREVPCDSTLGREA